MLVALLSRKDAQGECFDTGSPFSAKTWISNRASLLASWCRVCVALSLPLSLSHSPSFLRAGLWQLALHFLVIWSFGGLKTSLCLTVCCVVVVLSMLDKQRVCALVLDYILRVCVCDFCKRVCVTEQQDPGCHSAEQWQSRWSCMTLQCCRKQRGDLEETVFNHQWQSRSLYKFLCSSSLPGAPLRKKISSLPSHLKLHRFCFLAFWSFLALVSLFLFLRHLSFSSLSTLMKSTQAHRLNLADCDGNWKKFYRRFEYPAVSGSCVCSCSCKCVSSLVQVLAYIYFLTNTVKLQPPKNTH